MGTGGKRSERAADADATPDADPAQTGESTVDTLLGSALAGMIVNLAAFGNELDEAVKLLRAERAVNGGRRGYMMALKAVVDFCDRAGLEVEQRLPFNQLFLALLSADAGAVDPLLKVVLRPNAPRLTDAERRQRGYLAATMEALIRGGSKSDDAARWVASRSRKMFAAGRVKTDLWKAVKAWRVAAMGGDKTQDWEAVAFRAACEVLDRGDAIGEQGAEVLLKMAADQGTIQETPSLT